MVKPARPKTPPPPTPRNRSTTVPRHASLPAPARATLPAQHGMLQMNGATLEGGAERCDAFDVVVDELGRVAIVLVTATGLGADLSPDGIRKVLVDELRATTPMRNITSALERYLAAHVALRASVALGVARFWPLDSSIEILNAGLPPMLCLLPADKPRAFASRSAAVDAAATTVHPYELAPLAWGSLWVFGTPGATRPELDAATELAARIRSHSTEGPSLATAPPGHLRSVIGEIVQPSPTRDRTLVFVGTDPDKSAS